MNLHRNALGTICWWMCLSLCLALAPRTVAAAPATVRLFILSGQSNMVGLNPDTTFTPAVKKAFSNDEVIVVKSALGGQPIRRWYKAWKKPAEATLPPKAAPTRPGDLYDVLMAKVKSATQDKKVGTIAFVWMQGERDAKEGLSAAYAESLAGLVRQLRDDLKRPDTVVVIGRLSGNMNGEKHWDAVRLAQQKVAEQDPQARWVDTDDLNGPNHGLHYTKDGYDELGRRFAAKAVELLSQMPAAGH